MCQFSQVMAQIKGMRYTYKNVVIWFLTNMPQKLHFWKPENVTEGPPPKIAVDPVRGDQECSKKSQMTAETKILIYK